MQIFAQGRYSAPRIRASVVGVPLLSVLTVALFTGGVVWATDGDDQVIHACLHNANGKVRVVGSVILGLVSAKERRVSWRLLGTV